MSLVAVLFALITFHATAFGQTTRPFTLYPYSTGGPITSWVRVRAHLLRYENPANRNFKGELCDGGRSRCDPHFNVTYYVTRGRTNIAAEYGPYWNQSFIGFRDESGENFLLVRYDTIQVRVTATDVNEANGDVSLLGDWLFEYTVNRTGIFDQTVTSGSTTLTMRYNLGRYDGEVGDLPENPPAEIEPPVAEPTPQPPLMVQYQPILFKSNGTLANGQRCDSGDLSDLCDPIFNITYAWSYTANDGYSESSLYSKIDNVATLSFTQSAARYFQVIPGTEFTVTAIVVDNDEDTTEFPLIGHFVYSYIVGGVGNSIQITASNEQCELTIKFTTVLGPLFHQQKLAPDS